MKIHYVFIWSIIIVVVLIHTWMPNSHAIETGGNRVAVLPFQINAEKEMDYLKKGVSDILESRLAAIREVEIVSPGAETDIHSIAELRNNPEEIRQIGERWNVDYIVYGSLTVIGKQVRLDTKMIELSGKKGLWSFYRKMDDLDEVIPATEHIAKEIEDTVFRKILPDKAATLSVEKRGTQVHKEKKDDSRLQSIELPIQIISLSAGDVEGDGTIEIVAVSAHDIHLLQVTGNNLVGHGEIKGEKYHSYLSVDVADINKNGKAEIYISCEHTGSGSLTSFVLEWNGEKFSPIIQDQNWYFHVNRTEKGDQLIGQKKGISIAYIPEIYELSWNKSGLTAERYGNFPDDTMVFGISKRFAGLTTGLFAALNSSDRLSIIKEDGGETWKSDAPYGGSERFVRTIADHKDTAGERFYLPQRIAVLDFEDKPMVIVPSNDSSSGRFLQKFRRYSNARFLAFTWDGIGLSISRKSRDLSGYVSDYCVADVTNDGMEDLIYALVLDRESAFRSGRSYIANIKISEFLIQHP